MLGTWDVAPDLADPSRVGGSIVISSAELRVSPVASCQGEPFHDPGPFDPPDSQEPMLSVDPVAGELEGEPLVFDVILSPPASGTVTVDWTTADLDYDVFYVIGATGDRAAFRVQYSEWSWVSRR